MKYTPPRLRALSGTNTKGNCADGSAAGSISDLCTTGAGINNSGDYCRPGGGDATYCTVGTAAYGGSDCCYTGTDPNDTCGTGGTPVP